MLSQHSRFAFTQSGLLSHWITFGSMYETKLQLLFPQGFIHHNEFKILARFSYLGEITYVGVS